MQALLVTFVFFFSIASALYYLNKNKIKTRLLIKILSSCASLAGSLEKTLFWFEPTYDSPCTNYK